MRCKAAGFAQEKLTRELRDMLLEDGHAITHALYCTSCETRDIALKALSLADWGEQDYLMALAARGA